MGAGDGLALAGAAFQTVLLSFTAIAILLHVLRTEHVSLDTILGGVCVYLLIGETFAYLCSMMELMRAGSYLEGGQSLRIPPNVNHLLGRRPELTYFSFPRSQPWAMATSCQSLRWPGFSPCWRR